MEKIYLKAIRLLDLRIKSCGRGISEAVDEFSVLYWNKELALAQFKKHKIEKRLKVNHNVIKIDFISKKRVA